MSADFEWEPLDFLELLGCIPKSDDEYGISHIYEIDRGGIRLLMTVWPLDREVQLSLYSSTQVEPLVHLRLIDTPGARVVKDKRGNFIEFAGANLFSGRFDQSAAAPYGFRVWADPYFKIVPFSYVV